MKGRLHRILAGSIGNLVEWFDWYAYSAAALYFAPVFFPHGDRTAQLLQAAAVFAVGFFARPLGAWLMGLYADRAGRKAGLTLTMTMMCLGSLAIALAPGTASIGMLAPTTLVLARILQGLSLGGEYGASATYLSEVAGRAHRGFWSSFHYVTLIGGQLVALAVLLALQQFLPPQEMTRWGWRIPFFIGAGLAVVAWWLRRSLPESGAFLEAQRQGTTPGGLRLLFTQFPREAFTIIGMSAGGNLVFYVSTTYMQKYLTNSAGFTIMQATEISAAMLLVFMLVQPLFGTLSDRLGRKSMVLFAFGGLTLVTWPIMVLVARTGSPLVAFLLLTAGLLVQAAYTAISAVVKAELFPTHLRGLGVGLPYALANAVFGGTAEYIALWFKSAGMESGFFVYCTLVLAVSFLVVLTMPDTRRHSRIAED